MRTTRLRITIEREARGWSKSELARRAGLNQATVQVIENARMRPYPSQLEKLARALEWSGDPAALVDPVEITTGPAPDETPAAPMAAGTGE